ncbi:hypothetical protein Sp245p_24675 (plasmid) [Azospirillum baldaniorum]|uniref:Uncharacterized protein n=1 Tax=Azospirillum baldaniorum TaxID=1064539 RepID=A0A9P1JYU2_9PROT|nr:hypothetical protein Sp245p_24675 [Azospirillum baldaniorum]CCD02386.1 protein of unknown function [Azospirillum baldaniorum]
MCRGRTDHSPVDNGAVRFRTRTALLMPDASGIVRVINLLGPAQNRDPEKCGSEERPYERR